MVGRRRSIVFFVLLGFLGVAIFAQQTSSTGQYPASLLAGLQWRDVGPMRGGTHVRRRGPRRPARHFLFRLGRRRRVEDRERRPHLVPDLR